MVLSQLSQNNRNFKSLNIISEYPYKMRSLPLDGIAVCALSFIKAQSTKYVL